jgi:hypothetical protein
LLTHRLDSFGRAFASLLLAFTLAACGGGGGGGAGGTPAPADSITLAPSVGTLGEGGTSEITATLSSSIAAGGVRWTLVGGGSLTNETTTKVTYVAPATLSGAINPTIIATSISKDTVSNAVSLTVNGAPVLNVPTLYPLNEQVSSNITFLVAGGTQPYTWAVTAGTLPAGLTLGTSTTSAVSISGTPTAQGSATFTLTVTDSVGRTASAPVTLEVRARSACLLQGDYAFLYSGFDGDTTLVRAGRLVVAADGTVTGVEDFAAPNGRTNAAITSGTCTSVAASPIGTLAVKGGAGDADYQFASLSVAGTSARIHRPSGNNPGIYGSGSLVRRTGTLTATPTGEFAFGLWGQTATGGPMAVAGRATLAADGSIQSGRIDVAGDTPRSGAALTGTFGTPDAAGRGSATLTFGGTSLTVAYYVVGPDRMYAVTTGTNAPRLGGFVTRQVGAGASGWDASAFAQPAVLSVWGMEPTRPPQPVTTLGRFSSGTATTVDLDLDTTTRGTAALREQLAGATLAVAADGRATVGATNGSHSYVVYLDGVANGYVVETQGTKVGFGLLERQTGAPFTTFAGGTYVVSTQFGSQESALTLLSAANVTGASLSASATSASFNLDTATGRATGNAGSAAFGGLGVIVYVVDANRLRIMGDGRSTTGGTGTAISWIDKE